MYKLYTDKQEIFEAQIELTGASIKNSFARLILESDEWNLTFEGKIDSNGSVKVPIKKLKGVLNEGDKGNLKLEVIAEDVYFKPWEDSFEVNTSRKITVEVKSQTEKGIIEETKPKVVLKEAKSLINKKLIKEYIKTLVKNDIPLDKIYSHQEKLNTITEGFLKENKINEDTKKEFIIKVIQLLK